MSRKHNTQHQRSRSHYKERLSARSVGRSPMTAWSEQSLTAAKKREQELHITALESYDRRSKS